MSINVTRWWPVILVLVVAVGSTGEVQTRNGLSAGPSIELLMPEMVREAFSRSCQSCHGPQGHGIIGVAPDLRRLASRTSEDWGRYLRISRNVHPVSAPPPLWLTAVEMDLMARFLVTLSTRMEIRE